MLSGRWSFGDLEVQSPVGYGPALGIPFWVLEGMKGIGLWD